jgi:hypothetical protein
VKPAVSPSGHRTVWRRYLVGLGAIVIAAALIGYQIVPPFSDWINDVLGSLGIGE